MCRSGKDGYKIFLNSEYSREDAERFCSDLLKHTEYLMLAQAVAYLLGKRDLVKGFWSEGDNPWWGFHTKQEQLQWKGGADEPEITVNCRWIPRWRGKMCWKTEWNAVLKIQVFHRRIPDGTHSLSLFCAEVWSGEEMEINVLKNSIEMCGSGGCFLGTSQVTAETRQVIFGEWDEAETLKFVLFISSSQGWWQWLCWGWGCLTVTPYSQYQPCHCLHPPQRSDLIHSDASSQVAKENSWAVTKPDQPWSCLFFNTVPRRQKRWASQFSPGNRSCHPCW